MKKSYKYMFFTLLLLILANPLFAHDPAHPSESTGDPYIDLILGQVAFMEGRITSLAEAIPEDKYSWRPGEGVRSTAEQLAHTIGAAYGIPSMMGAEMPSHINMEIEKTITKKDEILKNLKASFEAATIFLKNYDTANYDEIVKTPFGEFPQRAMILIMNNHYHEHLGQLITYARVNGITPPWSVKSEDQEK